MEQLPLLRQLVVMLTTSELIQWPLNEAMMGRLSQFKLVGVVDNEQSDLMDRLRDKVWCRPFTRSLTDLLSISVLIR